MVEFLFIPDWSKFQHYKDRNPPWIKLHSEQVSSYKFELLPDASKAHLILIWVLASQYENRIPFDHEWIAKKISATESIDLERLVSDGFLQVDSELQASSKQSAIPETETETETETEQRVARKTRLPANWKMSAEQRAYCKQKQPDLNPEDVERNFAEYWHGDGRTKLDWDCVWKTWVRNERSNKRSNGAGEKIVQTPADRNAAAAERYLNRRIDDQVLATHD